MRVLRRLTIIRSRGVQAPGASGAAITYHDFAFSTFLVSSPNFSCLLGLLYLIFLLDLTYRRFVNCYAEGKTDELSYFLFYTKFLFGSTWMAFNILVRWYLLCSPFWISLPFGQYVFGYRWQAEFAAPRRKDFILFCASFIPHGISIITAIQHV